MSDFMLFVLGFALGGAVGSATCWTVMLLGTRHIFDKMLAQGWFTRDGKFYQILPMSNTEIRK